MIIIKDKEGDNLTVEAANKIAQNELEILKEIKHENIIKYYYHFKETFNKLEHICIICEYCKV